MFHEDMRLLVVLYQKLPSISELETIVYSLWMRALCCSGKAYELLKTSKVDF
jgi:hypothetical protein